MCYVMLCLLRIVGRESHVGHGHGLEYISIGTRYEVFWGSPKAPIQEESFRKWGQRDFEREF